MEEKELNKFRIVIQDVTNSKYHHVWQKTIETDNIDKITEKIDKMIK
jgi:hypothetical protein